MNYLFTKVSHIHTFENMKYFLFLSFLCIKCHVKFSDYLFLVCTKIHFITKIEIMVVYGGVWWYDRVNTEIAIGHVNTSHCLYGNDTCVTWYEFVLETDGGT